MLRAQLPANGIHPVDGRRSVRRVALFDADMLTCSATTLEEDESAASVDENRMELDRMLFVRIWKLQVKNNLFFSL